MQPTGDSTAHGATVPAPRGAGGPLAAGLPLCALTLLLNLPSWRAYFVGDDFDFLLLARDTERVTDALWLTFWGEWEPLWHLTWYIDYRLWGFEPQGFHATNTLWLALAVVALFGIVRELLPASRLAAWAAALLFLTHPLHDETVTYLAARGHLLATTLCLFALWAWAGVRGETRTPRARIALRAAALACGLLAALAKETAVVLPVWAAALELALAAPRGRGAARRAATAFAAFAVPALASVALRGFVVGFDSAKLTGALEDTVGPLGRLAEDLPGYALLGALPLPFGFTDADVLARFRPLGWALVAGALLAWAAAEGRAAWTRREASRELRVFGLGVVLALSSLAPVFWADLPLRRRYVFTASVGIALAVAPLVAGAGRRVPRTVGFVLAALVLAGAAGTLQRNELYRRSGEVARGLLETVRGVPLAADRELEAQRDVVLVTLPRAWGGDYLSGAYLLHETDLESALRLFVADEPRLACALKCYRADDYRAEATVRGDNELGVSVRFRDRSAWEAARERDPADDRVGDSFSAVLEAQDPRDRVLRYRLRLDPATPAAVPPTVYVYSGGGFFELRLDRAGSR